MTERGLPGWCWWYPANPPASAVDIRDVSLIPRSGRSPGGGHGNPLQYSCLENPMDRGAWRAIVHGVAKSWTQLKRLSMQEYTEDLQKWSRGSCMLPAQFPFNIWHNLRTIINIEKINLHMILFSKVQNLSHHLFFTYVLLHFQGLVQGTALHFIIMSS